MSFTRRDALQALMIAPVLGVLGVVRSARSAGQSGGRAPVLDGARQPAPFADLAAGTRFGECVLVQIGSVERGAVPITLRAPGGETFRVDVLRHDEATPGIARAGSLGLYLANGGTGRKPTDEQQGLAVMALAGVLANREAVGGAVPKLLTLREREPLLAGVLAPR
jgi:hypothetical protein